jgi:curved DNA-binding protein
MDKDYYKIMGIAPNATDKEIKTAYRRLARKYHPDLSKEANAETLFKEMGEAYETLKDSTKRAQYDQHLKNREYQKNAQQKTSRHNYQGTSAGFGANPDFDSDIFSSIFGHARAQNQARAGHDYQGTVTVTLEEAYTGTSKSIQVPSNDESSTKTQTLNVKIPAGVKSGQQMRLAGQGAPGSHGGPRGDIYLNVDVMKHHLFDVKDNDIYLTLPITPWEAALGATILVPTLAGKIDLKIPPESQGGQKLRIKQRGLPGATPGDQFVLLKISTPPASTEAAKELYKKMAETMPYNPRKAMGV